MILGEIFDCRQFPDPKWLLAFVVLDPSVYQSCNFQAKRTMILKRESKVLRYPLMNGAYNVVKNITTFKVYDDGRPDS